MAASCRCRLAAEATMRGRGSPAQRRERWRRRLLPLAGGAALLFIWWALVAIFHVRSFIAPSPEVVVVTLYAEVRHPDGQSRARPRSRR